MARECVCVCVCVCKCVKERERETGRGREGGERRIENETGKVD